MPLGIHPGFLIVVLILVLIVFGPGKLPELGSAVGKAMREFRKATTDLQDEIKHSPSSEAPTTTATPTQPAEAARTTSPDSPKS
jgi:sec-independent protein translocase protein TatA